MFIIKQGRKVIKQNIKTYQKALQAAYELAMPEVPANKLSRQQINAMNFIIEEVN